MRLKANIPPSEPSFRQPAFTVVKNNTVQALPQSVTWSTYILRNMSS